MVAKAFIRTTALGRKLTAAWQAHAGIVEERFRPTLLLAHEFAQDARSMEAKRPVSQHRDEMQDDAAKAEARED
jgi:hypothetical protein